MFMPSSSACSLRSTPGFLSSLLAGNFQPTGNGGYDDFMVIFQNCSWTFFDFMFYQISDYVLNLSTGHWRGRY